MGNSTSAKLAVIKFMPSKKFVATEYSPTSFSPPKILIRYKSDLKIKKHKTATKYDFKPKLKFLRKSLLSKEILKPYFFIKTERYHKGNMLKKITKTSIVFSRSNFKI